MFFSKTASRILVFSKGQQNPYVYSQVLFARKKLQSCCLNPILSVHKAPKCYFSSEKPSDKKTETQNDQPPTENKTPEDQAREEETSFFLTDDFKDYILERSLSPETDFQYTKKTIFEFPEKLEDVDHLNKVSKIKALGWVSACYATFAWIHPWATVIPVYQLGKLLLGFAFLQKFKKGIIKRIDIVDNNHVKIYSATLGDKGVLSEIESIKILNVMKMPEKRGYDLRGHVLLIKFTDSNTMEQNDQMVIMMHPTLTKVENLELLKCIVNGQNYNVEKFRKKGTGIPEDKQRKQETKQAKK